MAELSTLPKDIYNLFDPEVDHVCSEENAEQFANNLKNLIVSRLRARKGGAAGLRFSAMGKPDRKVWMDNHPDPEKQEKMPLKTYLKFLYGDVIEEVLLFLTKEAGHSVEDEQKEVEVQGVKGHIDAIIDGVVVDIKSASSYGYKKFESNNVLADDPFGYVAQLAGYADVLTPGKSAAWLAMDKVSADICVSPLSAPVISHHPPGERIAHLKEVIKSETPPELCYQPVPDGKSGNLKLDVGCSYCEHKSRCFPDARLFLYSTGPRWLTTVVKEPLVPEVKQ